MNSQQFQILNDLLENEYDKGYRDGQEILNGTTLKVLKEIRDEIFRLPTNQMATNTPNCDGDSKFVLGVSRASVAEIINNIILRESEV